MKAQRAFSLSGLFIVLIALFGTFGWIANIAKLILMLDGPITAMLIARVVGIFAVPFGAIIGFF